MYKVIQTDTEVMWNSIVHPLLTLADEYGGRAQIVRDGHCLVLLLAKSNGVNDNTCTYEPTCWWFDEAVTAVVNHLANTMMAD